MTTTPTPSRAKRPTRLAARLMALPTPAHVAMVLVVTIAKYGIDHYPSMEIMRALTLNWRNPHASPFLQPPDDFRLASPVAALLAALAHCTSLRTFLAFHLGLTVVALAFPYLLSRVRKSPELRSLLTLVLLGTAVPAVLFDWIGGYDAITVGALALALLSENRVLNATGWLVAAFNNAPVAMIGFAMVAVHRFAAEKSKSIAPLAINAGGLLSGMVLIQLLLRHWGVATSRLNVYTDIYGFSRFTTSFFHFAPLIILGGFGVGWLLLGTRELRTLQGGTAAIGAAAVASIGVPFIALDETRVLSIAGFALLLSVAVLGEARLPKATVHQVLHRMLPVSLLLVIPIIWDNQLLYAGYENTRAILRYLILGN